MKALVACHAGPGVGLGHLSRSLRVAQALRDTLDAEVELLVQGPAFAHAGLRAWPHRFVDATQDLALAIGAADRRADADVLLLDLMPSRVPAGLAALLAQRRRGGHRSVAIDGLLQHRAALDLVFLPSILFNPPEDLADGAPILFGWDCLLLDPPAQASAWRAGADNERRVLALTGGSDATGLGQCWPALLDARLDTDVQLDWVTGPFAPPPHWPAAPRIRIQEHRAPSGLGPLMQRARYAVTVFGVSCFELLRLGVPSVVFSPYGDKDAAVLQALADAGVARVARDAAEATAMLVDLMQDDALAERLSRTALARLSVSGGERLARWIGQSMQ